MQYQSMSNVICLVSCLESFVVCLVSFVVCLVSFVLCHLSCVICLVSCVLCLVPFVLSCLVLFVICLVSFVYKWKLFSPIFFVCAENIRLSGQYASLKSTNLQMQGLTNSSQKLPQAPHIPRQCRKKDNLHPPPHRQLVLTQKPPQVPHNPRLCRKKDNPRPRPHRQQL